MSARLNNRESVQNTKLIVAAIDFGTTFSGYAYSFQHDPKRVLTNQKWSWGGNGLTEKTSTCILFSPEETFVAFGYEAEKQYAKLAESEQHRNWRFFRRFKMQLYKKQRLKRRMQLKDEQGQKMSALKVFSESIKYLRNHCLQQLENEVAGCRKTDVHWVLTVPAIWNDAAKQFMREAAVEAGIPNDQITLALEPEAAAVYCSEARTQRNEDGSMGAFAAGTKFLLVDLGGGTADLSVNQVETDGSLRQMCPPSGGPWGGTNIDTAFFSFMETVFGENILAKFEEECKSDMLTFYSAFEFTKRDVCPEDNHSTTVHLPVSFLEILQEEGKSSLREILDSSVYNGRAIGRRGGKIQLNAEVVNEFFEKPLEAIKSHLTEVFTEQRVHDIKLILLVGGFSESKIVQSSLRNAFKGKTIINPSEAGTAVLKGAVMFGHNANSVSSRIIAHSYGLNAEVPFNPAVHPYHLSYSSYGQKKCGDIFDIMIKAGTRVYPGRTSFTKECNSESSSAVEIYRTASKTPAYCTEDGCSQVGNVRIGEIGDIIEVTMYFGHTCLTVDAKEKGTDKVVSAVLDFLV